MAEVGAKNLSHRKKFFPDKFFERVPRLFVDRHLAD
jgi:hypothetical protein